VLQQLVLQQLFPYIRKILKNLMIRVPGYPVSVGVLLISRSAPQRPAAPRSAPQRPAVLSNARNAPLSPTVPHTGYYSAPSVRALHGTP